MNARAFLVRGLLAGLAAGFAAFAVAYVVGEPHVDRAIAVEESTAAPADHHSGAASAHSHDSDAPVVSRHDQSTWGLATGTVAVGVTIGYAAVVLIPFLKYPATPPAVGSGETIGQRTALYFAFLFISVATAAACTVLASRLLDSRGVQSAVLIGAGTYVAVVVAASSLMPTVDEIGDFPGDVLWDFRLASLITLTALWATVTTVLTAFIGRLHAEHARVQARREFAASL